MPLITPTTREAKPYHDAISTRDEFREVLEAVVMSLAALAVVSVVALVLRGVELFITTKIWIPEAQAATAPAFEAKLLLRTDEKITLAPGAEKLYTVAFKNLGTATWKNSGTQLLSIYTMDPKYRTSPFYHPAWRTQTQPVLMKDPATAPGTVGFFDFRLRAPEKPGTYVETFQIAAEDLLWIPGGKFSIEITVMPSLENRELRTENIAVDSQPTPYPLPPTPSTDGYAATLLLRSHKTDITMGPNETVAVTLGFKNSGTRTWQMQSLRRAGIHIAAPEPTFHHLSWPGPDEIVRETRPTQPGELAFLRFNLQAPNQKGSYRPRFTLVADGSPVSGGEIEIPVTVTADGPSSAAPVALPAARLIPEPALRVGLYKTRTPIMITGTGDYAILDGTGRSVEVVRGGQPSKITFDFDYHKATVISPSATHVLTEPVRFVPSDPGTVFTIPSYSHPPEWNTTLNDNRFRGALEVYYVDDTGNLWVLNELPMEMYLRGLAETSNNSHLEFQKALVTAARTYALYHYSRNTKHGGHFHIDAHYDQVYRGYGNEIRTPSVTRAVEETRGAIVTYNSEIAITPYYSRSDGRTRAWEEVWGGGPKPWLKSVPTPYDAGQTLWGHGVGMSARDALLRAREGGANWEQILKYYYTGTELRKMWN